MKEKKCTKCGRPLHPLHEGIRCRLCQRIMEREVIERPFEEKITKLETRLAICRMLLAEHQYDRDKHCVSCGAHDEQSCYPDCAIAAEIEELSKKGTMKIPWTSYNDYPASGNIPMWSIDVLLKAIRDKEIK